MLARLALLAALTLLAASCAGGPGPATQISAAPTGSMPLAAPPTPAASAYPAPAVAAALPSAYPAPAGAAPAQAAPPTYGFQVVKRYPHDATAWTEGLVYVGDGTLYEGTGEYQHSSLREVDLASGAVRRSVGLGDPGLYGEGITPVGDKIFQLTWQNCQGLIYERASFTRLKTFSYPRTGAGGCAMEGWGLTSDGAQLIMSDGTETISFVDPAATASSGELTITRQIHVSDRGAPVANLNELEYVDGQILANVWLTDRIVRIDPASGQVTAWIDLSGLLGAADRQGSPPPDVLNGIAYDQAGRRLFVTGKYWPALFEITLVPPQAHQINLPLLGRG
jgi:glutamine cyclotransferase